jgi:hypothetical protein
VEPQATTGRKGRPFRVERAGQRRKPHGEAQTALAGLAAAAAVSALQVEKVCGRDRIMSPEFGFDPLLVRRRRSLPSSLGVRHPRRIREELAGLVLLDPREEGAQRRVAWLAQRGAGGCGRGGPTASRDGGCARGPRRSAGRDEEAGVEVEQRNWTGRGRARTVITRNRRRGVHRLPRDRPYTSKRRTDVLRKPDIFKRYRQPSPSRLCRVIERALSFSRARMHRDDPMNLGSATSAFEGCGICVCATGWVGANCSS